MGLDIRLPLGVMFVLLGLLLVGFGFASDPAIYERSLGININVRWGWVLFVFGALMLWFAWHRTDPTQSSSSRRGNESCDVPLRRRAGG
jgi:protein-S-isoprenylcysteine O-methyltransferase Ste14